MVSTPKSLVPTARRGMATLRSGPKSTGPTGILMMNMGGPSTLDEVHSFLSNLFHDGDLIPLPFQRLLAPRIAARRTPKIREQYAAIGGGSPILRWTRTQGEGMAALLDELSPHTAPHKAYVAFRYAQPLTDVALDEMERDGVRRAVAFTQYPQYSCSTTGSSLNELYRHLERRAKEGKGAGIDWSVIDRWPTHPGLVEAVAQNVHNALLRLPASVRSQVPLLFSAHSLPMSIVNRGDPYPSEVAATVAAVVARLPALTGFSSPHRLVWQSQVGPSAWLGQQTSDAIQGLRKLGHKHAVTVPIAFTSDHIETLYELDIENKEEAEKIGIHLERADSLNDSPIFIRGLADLAASHLSTVYPPLAPSPRAGEIAAPGWTGGWDVPSQRTSVQMGLRCPGCTNETCGRQKRFFERGGRAEA